MLAKKPEQVKNAYRARTLHYINYLKVPSKIHERRLGPNGVVGVLECRPDAEAAYCRYVTNGMAEVWQTRPDKGIVFTELIFYTRAAAKWAIDFLARLAAYPSDNHTFLAVGQTLPLAGPIVPNSHLTGLVFIDPIFEKAEFRTISTLDSKAIEILWAVPITESEREFIVARGHREWMQVLTGKIGLLDTLVDFGRESMV